MEQLDPLTGLPVLQPAQLQPNPIQQPANTLGTARPVFNQGTQQSAQGVFGEVNQRQASIQTPSQQAVALQNSIDNKQI